jgi:hypothetical protein
LLVLATMQQHTVSLLHGGYFFASGLWPIVHLRSFENVTGPKTDRWLVRTVGGLVTVIGATLLVGARRRELSGALRLLGIGSALTLAVVDVVYASRGRISPIYFADAAAETSLIVGWITARRFRERALLHRW